MIRAFLIALVFFTAVAASFPSMAQVEDTTRRVPPEMMDLLPPAQDSLQVSQADSLVLDTTGIRFSEFPLLSSGGVQLDYGKLVSIFLPFESKFEAGVFLRFKGRVQASVDYGTAMVLPNQNERGSTYLASGHYFKSGLAWLMYIDPVNKILLGGNYGYAQFRDRVTFTEENAFIEQYPLGLQRENREATWAEVYLGSEGRFKENVFIGFRIHYRRLLEYQQPLPNDFPIRQIPGYGATQGNGVIGLNFYLRYVWGFGNRP
jgi:hypothetical protein